MEYFFLYVAMAFLLASYEYAFWQRSFPEIAYQDIRDDSKTSVVTGALWPFTIFSVIIFRICTKDFCWYGFKIPFTK